MRTWAAILALMLMTGCDLPMESADGRWLVITSTGPFSGTVTFDNGHEMTMSGDGSMIHPLGDHEGLCWVFMRDDREGSLSAYVGDRTGDERVGFAETAAPNGRIEGCAR